MEIYDYFGLQMSKKSCWMDTCLMALFFPDKMKMYFSQFVQKSNHSALQNIKEEVENLITLINTKRVISNVDRLRSMLHNYASQQQNPSLLRAFEKENSLGYVFYYLVEFLKLFNVPPLHLQSLSHHKYTHIVELKDCDGSTIQECLNTYLTSWRIINLPEYLVIEMTNSTLVPMEHIDVNGTHFELQSMIVSNCNHFVTHVKKKNKWLLYDDFRTLHKKPLTEMTFGENYIVQNCQFAYGETNTFFFYIVMS